MPSRIRSRTTFNGHILGICYSLVDHKMDRRCDNDLVSSTLLIFVSLLQMMNSLLIIVSHIIIVSRSVTIPIKFYHVFITAYPIRLFFIIRSTIYTVYD
ncbi:Hypothetical protein [Arabidopsis thaliana]|uniref:F12K8.25 protein n=1 Tax=Arabidopsis thaliana TaxID=3702 RepID=Q9SK83_ARATH|nr:Hypothetical protein [Arabidopsis thaliana]